MKSEQLDKILENLENGNIDDFRNTIRKMSKWNILDLIEYNRNVGSINEINLIIQLKRAFK